MSVIPQGSRILVTGANGFLGSHIVNQLLLSGYCVRGTVRAEPKSAWLKEYFSRAYGDGRLEIAIVPDMAAKEAFDQAVKGTSGVVHVASNLTFSEDPNNVIPETVEGTKNALTAAETEPLVKRFVFTSSAAAASWPKPNEVFDIDENTWNTGCVERAWAPPPYESARAWDVYGASKTESEQALWDFARNRSLHFTVNSVLPNAIWGPIFMPGKQNASSAGFITGIYENGLKGLEMIPPQHHCDVRDAARLHVAALIDPDVKNERIFAYGYPYNWNLVLSILRKLSPNHQFPEDMKDDSKDVSRILRRGRAEEILRKNFGCGFTTVEETVKANVAHLL
ncbi:flavonol reductase [Glonium stellatum]|uniref:Flavonol reductase n=1 Tax=Glonium stellatum TaxID=574774 RepID=A0A8E2FAH9_9PEZI|nr:flavonol reductase [Glonium stellatum]